MLNIKNYLIFLYSSKYSFSQLMFYGPSKPKSSHYRTIVNLISFLIFVLNRNPLLRNVFLK